jgi:hypothetical protein
MFVIERIVVAVLFVSRNILPQIMLALIKLLDDVLSYCPYTQLNVYYL